MSGSAETSLPGTPELLAWYRQRIEQLQRGRDEMVVRIEELGVPRVEQQRSALELRSTQRALSAAQEKLAAARSELAEERGRTLMVARDNEELALVVQEKQRDVAHLLSVSQPSVDLGGAPGAVRVVYMSSEQTERLEARCAELEGRLAAGVVQHEAVEKDLVQDRRAREAEHLEHRQRADAAVEAASDRASQAEARLDDALNALLLARYESTKELRDLQEEVARLRACNSAVSSARQADSAKHKAGLAKARDAMLQRADARTVFHRQEELKAKAGFGAAVRKNVRVQEATHSAVSKLQEKVAHQQKAADREARTQRVHRDSTRKDVQDMRSELRLMSGVLGELTSAAAQQLREKVDAAIPRVEALAERARA